MEAGRSGCSVVTCNTISANILLALVRQHLYSTGMPSHFFQRPCFGSLYHGNFLDVDQFLSQMHHKKQIMDQLRRAILSIAIFDLWISNEDRTGNNYNMLFNPTGKVFIPIDHVMAFNGNNLDKDPYALTVEDSILNSSLVQRLFFRTLQPERNELRLRIINDFTHDVAQCHKHLSTFLQHVPEEWSISLTDVNERIQYLFSNDWTSTCSDLFSRYLQIALIDH